MSTLRQAGRTFNRIQEIEKRAAGTGKIKKDQAQSETAIRKHRGIIICAVVILIISGLIYAIRLDKLVGSVYVDDAYYVLLGKALATGYGYSLINTPSPGIVPIYPPVFPALLSIVFRVVPSFPGNLWLLKSVSIVAMLGAGILAWFYLNRERKVGAALALGIAAATVLNPGIVHYVTTSVMSEPVFTCIQMAALLLLERGVRVRKENSSSAWAGIGLILLGSVFASVAFLTRSIGVTLLAAGMIYLLKERLWRAALVFALTVTICAAPWVLYSRLHAPTPAQQVEQQGYIVSNYAAQIWQRRAGDTAAGKITLSELPERIWNNGSQIVTSNIGYLMISPMAMITGPMAMELFSVLLSVLMLLGYIGVVRERLTLAEILLPLSLLVTVLWPWDDTLRFVLPLTALLTFYLTRGLGAILSRVVQDSEELAQQMPRGAMIAAAWIVFSLCIIGNLNYIGMMDHPRFRTVGQQGTFAEIETMMQWVSERLPDDGICASLNPALVYLYTGRKTISAQELVRDWEEWKRMNVRYLVLTSPYGVPAQDSAGNKIRILYQSKRNPNIRVVDLGPKDTRAIWVRFDGTES